MNPRRKWRIALGADHGGFRLKQRIAAWLRARGHRVNDVGTFTPEPCDYPAIGAKVSEAVARRRADRGILFCKSGVGIAIVANKVPGSRAANCRDVRDARLSREHNDTNVLALGATRLSTAQVQRIIAMWLSTPFHAVGRHARRVRQIAALERRYVRRTPGA